MLEPGIVRSRLVVFPPNPYMLMADSTALAQTAPSPEGARGLAGASSAVMAILAVVGMGVGVRSLQQSGGGWIAPLAAAVGLTLTPSLHYMGASVTASTSAPAGVGLTTVAKT